MREVAQFHQIVINFRYTTTETMVGPFVFTYSRLQPTVEGSGHLGLRGGYPRIIPNVRTHLYR